MKWDVKIPNWNEGKPLYIRGLEAETEEQVRQIVQESYVRIGGRNKLLMEVESHDSTKNT